MSYNLTENTFIMFAMKHYDNPHCVGMNEFNDDLKRFRYVKRLLRKYNAGKDLRERLIINHLIVIYNLFGIDAATKMLFFKIEEKFWPQLKTFLVFLNCLPEEFFLNEKRIVTTYIPIDINVANALRNI